MSQKLRISVGLSKDEYSLLEQESKRLDVSMSWLARKLIIDGISIIEELNDTRKLSERLASNEQK
ncbi:ribbon-helix-helix protein, CopG family [Vibrio parahaemolyticus]|uniref:ribbon-helix-helix protein, CopG family n=1 Tax=Vibrio parahaemolyticus TaxID=670 RepID=UPI000471604E|nr:ribbon-helix-helix protein, CopG family [Vibrio parahaemolyticus]EKF9172823.1 ribbon-helix-helix protein, CopG family [Vibrio cholerae]EKF9850077.1 ribbon-helix-helix protein, CopG family [Vibrio cholerae]MCZ6382457.1 ribbon-helix-helix protein, CopG family [Vibrio parahaemolyticus]